MKRSQKLKKQHKEKLREKRLRKLGDKKRKIYDPDELLNFDRKTAFRDLVA